MGPGTMGQEQWALLDAEFEARTPSEATRAASRQLGGGLLRLLRSVLPDADLVTPWARCAGPTPHHPLVLGAGVSLAGGPPELAARAAALSACAGPASAAVRLLGLDPFAVQAMLARLAPAIDECAAFAAPVRRSAAVVAAGRRGPGPGSARRLPSHRGGASVCVLNRMITVTRGQADGPASARVPRIGIGGPVGSGKTALVAALCRALSGELTIGVVTNDIYTTEDADFLRRAGVLPDARIRAVQTGACPHTAIRDDISANLDAVEKLEADHPGLELILVESGGDNLTATFSYGLVHRQIFVIDVAGGDKVPRKGGPGVTRSDLLVINKTDLAALVGADLSVMARDAAAVRGDRPTVFTSLVADPAATEVAAWVRAVRSAVAPA